LPKVDAQAISDSATAADNVEANIGNLDAAVSSRSDHSASDVWSATTRTLTAATNITSDGNAIDQTKIANLDATVSSRAAETGGNIDAIKAKTDKLTFDASNNVYSTPQTDVTLAADQDVNVTKWANIDNLDAAVSSRSSHSASDVWSATTRTLTSAANITSDGNTIDQTKIANLDASVSSRAAETGGNIDAIKTKTDKLTFDASNNVYSTPQTDVTVGTNNDKTGYSLATDQSSVTIGTVNALGTQAKADVNAEVDTALQDIDLDHLVKSDYGASKPADGSLFDQIMNKDGSQTFDPSTDSLEAISDSSATGLSQQQVRDAMLLAPSGGSPASGSIDKYRA